MTSYPTTFTSYIALVDYLKLLPMQRTILLDGFMQSGKSITGRLLAEGLGRQCVDVDDFLGCQPGQYVDNLDLAVLRLVTQDTKGLILLGLCVKDAADALKLQNPFHVYVKRMVTMKQLWADKPQASLSTWICADRHCEADIESRNYHLRVLPHIVADCVFEKSTGYQ